MLALIAALLLAAPQTGFAYGRAGGSIMPFRVTIAVTGNVTATGAAPSHETMLTKEQLAVLNRVAFMTHFEQLPRSTSCTATPPDVATRYIRVGSRTVRVHGGCLLRFNRLWTTLSRVTR